MDASRIKGDDVSTGTSNGVLTSRLGNDIDDEWFSYDEITEYMLYPRESDAAIIHDDIGADGDQGPKIPMRKSIFPLVAPYVLFHSIDCKCPKLPASISKHLRWKLTGLTPKIVAAILRKSGFHLVTKSDECNWSGSWNQSGSNPATFTDLKSFQKLNCFPGSHNLGRKDHLWTNVNRMRKKFGLNQFGFVPDTFVLPRDMVKFKDAWLRNLGDKWIVKPPSSGRGQGIRVIDQWWEVPKWHSVVVQRYLAKPKLINGSKFDLRVYVLVTSVDPLRIYIYTEGLVRFASVKYKNDSVNLNDKFMHLTNTSINKHSPNYVVNDRVDSSDGHKWSFSTLWTHLARDNVDVKVLWNEMKDIVVKTLISAEASMRDAINKNVPSTYTSYELYGFDILLDEDYKPWLLEVNTLPSLHTDSYLDVAIKAPLIRNVFNIAGYQLPENMTIFQERQLVKEYHCERMRQDKRIYSTTLSSEEIRKQKQFLKSKERVDYVFDVIKNLTRDDIRQLIRYEDEITQIDKFEKIFPTCETHEYLKFFKTQRYYNLLFDAWEFQSTANRRESIQRLKTFCKRKIHLEPVLR